MPTETNARVELTSIVASIAMPAMHMAPPTSGNDLYRPVFVMRRPPQVEPASTPAIMGTSRNPDEVADAPRTIWRNSGRNTEPTTMTDPNSTAMTMETEKMSFLNIRSGSSGSSARRS